MHTVCHKAFSVCRCFAVGHGWLVRSADSTVGQANRGDALPSRGEILAAS